jgi:hypothetical protein
MKALICQRWVRYEQMPASVGRRTLSVGSEQLHCPGRPFPEDEDRPEGADGEAQMV